MTASKSKELVWTVGGVGTVAYAAAFEHSRFYSISGREGQWTLSHPKDGALFVMEGLETQIAARRAAQAHFESVILAGISPQLSQHLSRDELFLLVSTAIIAAEVGYSTEVDSEGKCKICYTDGGEMVFDTIEEAEKHASLRTHLLTVQAAIAVLSPAPQEHMTVGVEAEIARVVQSVNEWDDRTSPDDYPEHLLITSKELSDILRNFAETLAAPEGYGDAD